MTEEILKCKHGLFKVSCTYCMDMDDAQVIKEKADALNHNWYSNSFSDNSAHNSSMGDQEYDLDLEQDTDTADSDSD